MPGYICLLLDLCLLCRGSGGQTAGCGSFDNIRLDTEASVVNSFLKDEQERIWIGSDKGLFSYDGYAGQAAFGCARSFPYNSTIIPIEGSSVPESRSTGLSS